MVVSVEDLAGRAGCVHNKNCSMKDAERELEFYMQSLFGLLKDEQLFCMAARLD